MVLSINCRIYYNDKRDFIKQYMEDEELVGKYYLGAIQVGSEKESTSYINAKINDFAYIGSRVKGEQVNTDEPDWINTLSTNIKAMNNDKECAGIILEVDRKVKKSKPEGFWRSIYNFINPALDLDGLQINSQYTPCTAEATLQLLEKYCQINLKGKVCTVIGRSKLVGLPIVNLLINKGATVTCCNSTTPIATLEYFAYNSDIIISAAGCQDLITPRMVSDETWVVDIGTNFDVNTNKLVGDVHPDTYQQKNKNIYYTPVPGGMGLMTRAVLLEHFIQGIEYREKQILSPKMKLTLSDEANNQFILIPSQGDFNV